MVGNTGFSISTGVSYLWNRHDLCINGFPVFVSNVVAEYLESLHLKKLLKRLFMIASPRWSGILPSFIWGLKWLLTGWVTLNSFQSFKVYRGCFYWCRFWIITGLFQREAFEWCWLPFRKWWSRSFVSGGSSSWRVCLVVPFRTTMFTGRCRVAMVAAVFAILVMLYYVVKETKDPLDAWRLRRRNGSATFGHLFKRFAFEGGTICLLSSILVLFQLVDSFSVYNVITTQGCFRKSQKDLKGISR